MRNHCERCCPVPPAPPGPVPDSSWVVELWEEERARAEAEWRREGRVMLVQGVVFVVVVVVALVVAFWWGVLVDESSWSG